MVIIGSTKGSIWGISVVFLVDADITNNCRPEKIIKTQCSLRETNFYTNLKKYTKISCFIYFNYEINKQDIKSQLIADFSNSEARHELEQNQSFH